MNKDTIELNILELFAGTGSFSSVARKAGHKVFTSDYDPVFNTDYCVDILDFDIEKLPFNPDVIWASPPCESFSVASIGKHWNTDNTPKTENAKKGVAIIKKAIEIIDQLKPKYWFIENPRGKLRKLDFMQNFNRYTVTYCQYGDTRMKPTDIWTNANLELRPMCKNGMPCHISAPRGSRTGTQGIKTYRDRSIVPKQLCEHILSQLKSNKE